MYKTVFSGRRHLTFCGTAVERISTSLPRRTLKIGCKFTKDSPKVPRRGVNIRGFQTFFIPILSENAVVATFSCTISHRIMLRVGHHRQHGHTAIIVEIVFESHTDTCIPTDFELGRCTDSATEVGIWLVAATVALFLLRLLVQLLVLNISAHQMGQRMFGLSIVWYDICLPLISLYMLATQPMFDKRDW